MFVCLCVCVFVCVCVCVCLCNGAVGDACVSLCSKDSHHLTPYSSPNIALISWFKNRDFSNNSVKVGMTESAAT